MSQYLAASKIMVQLLFFKPSPTFWPSMSGSCAFFQEHILEWVLKEKISICCGEMMNMLSQ